MKKNVILLSILALTMTACHSEKREHKEVSFIRLQEPVVTTDISIFEFEEVKAEIEEENHLLQITALNFLPGGLEQCKVKDKIYSFSIHDENVKTTICKNSRIEVSALSDAGVVRFSAIDLNYNQELIHLDGEVNQEYVLGEERPMMRYYPKNPYGFTLVMAEEVTNINPELLKQWNELNDRLTSLLASIINAQENGEDVPQSLRDEVKEVEQEMAELAKKIKS